MLKQLLFTLFICAFVTAQQNNSTQATSGVFGTTGFVSSNTTSNTTNGSQNCSSHLDCASCISTISCVWCPNSPNGTSPCVSGHWYGPTESCTNWRWYQCAIPGTYAMLGAAGILILLIITSVLCVYCCCCRSGKKNAKKPKLQAIPLEEESESFISKHPKTDARRAELMKLLYVLESYEIVFGYFALDGNKTTYWQPASSQPFEELNVTFATPQVIGNLTWIISTSSPYSIRLFNENGALMTSFFCLSSCSPYGESRGLPFPTSIAVVSVRFSGVAPNTYIFEITADAPCKVGEPYINNTCLNCGIIPDPYRFERIPKLDLSKLKLDIDGTLSIRFNMDTVQTRNFITHNIYGPQDCSAAILVPWQSSTQGNQCIIDISVLYYWAKLFEFCPQNLQFFQTNDSASVWILFELGFTEDVDIDNGVFNTTITRDFLADYSLGVYVDRYVQLSANVNITECDGVVCQPSDECHSPGYCDRNTGQCVWPSFPDGTSCNDGDKCTFFDVCNDGVCAGVPEVCESQDSCLASYGICDPETGQCEFSPLENGILCNDFNPCTVNDTCRSGVCAGIEKSCDANDQCHLPGTCDKSTGICIYPEKSNDTLCEDNDPCTSESKCQHGICTATKTITCHSNSPCIVSASCNGNGGCSYVYSANGTFCDDLNLCTLGDYCLLGACISGTPVTCVEADQCHDAGKCNTATGICDNPEKQYGFPCNDDNLCTLGDVCSNGTCSGGSLVSCPYNATCGAPSICSPETGICETPCQICNDSSQCQNPPICHGQGTCNLNTRICEYSILPDYSSCNDSDLCTIGDHCLLGECVSNTSIQCQALDNCHFAGVCNPMTGECSHPVLPNNTICSDSNLCTLNDRCFDGVCTGIQVTCPSQTCYEDGICNPLTGNCSYEISRDGKFCSDGFLCTKNDSCISGVCIGDPVICSDPDQCHNSGKCDPDTGECHFSSKPNGTPCSDRNGCTLNDTCIEGVCTSTINVECEGTTPCRRSGICNPITGLCFYEHLPNGTNCNTDMCSTRQCSMGVCLQTSEVTCENFQPCDETGICHKDTGECHSPCPPQVSGAIVRQELRNVFPFAIKIATFTTKNTTLIDPLLISHPYDGTWNISTDPILDENDRGVITQYWYFSYIPIGTCELDGNYIFQFTLNGWNRTTTLLFYFDSQFFCGSVTNTSVRGTIRTFRDPDYSTSSTIVIPDGMIYVWISLETAFSISRVDLVSIFVSNETYPAYGLDAFEQVSYGIRFSMVALMPPFVMGSNDMLFTVKITYSDLNRKRRSVSDSSNKPGSIEVTKTVGVRVPMTTSTTGGEIANIVGDGQEKGKKLNISVLVVGVVGSSLFLGIVIMIAILLVRKNRMREIEEISHTTIQKQGAKEIRSQKTFAMASRSIKTI